MFDKIAEESRASIDKEDLKVLLPIVAKIQPRNILEIGAWKGYSAQTWQKAFNPDTFITLEKDPDSSYDERVNTLHIGWQMWYSSDSHDPQVLKTLKIYLPSIDFLFIDGDHSYEGVKKDFEMYSPLVRKGGIIAFHDALYHADKTEEVDIFWREIKQLYPYVEIKMSKNSTGIGVIWV